MWINRTNRRGPTRQSSCDSRTSGKKGRGIFVAFSQLRELGEQAVALGLLAEAERLYGPRDATYRFARVTLDPKGPNLRFSPTWDEICIELSPSTITYPDQAWVERCGRPTTHGHTSPREAFPAPIVLERTWRGRVPFPTSATGFSRPRRTKSATSCSASTPSANQGVRTAGPLYTVGVVDRTISAVAPLAGMESGYRISSNRCESEIVESNRFSGHRWRAV
jgi:hypothetical protein